MRFEYFFEDAISTEMSSAGTKVITDILPKIRAVYPDKQKGPWKSAYELFSAMSTWDEEHEEEQRA